MALGRRRDQFQQELMVPTSALPRSPGHPFYAALNKLLAEAGFDTYVEGLCEPLYREGGRPSIPPGVFFRMLFIGYFEGIDSQRGIAWRCSDSLSLRSFLGLKPTESTPDHSSLTIIRQRLPKELIEQVFSSRGGPPPRHGPGSRGTGLRRGVKRYRLPALPAGRDRRARGTGFRTLPSLWLAIGPPVA